MPTAEADEAPRRTVSVQHMVAVSAAVFVSGAIGTVLYGVWRRPAWTAVAPVAREAAECAARAAPSDATETTSALSLFREMNAAVFRRGARRTPTPAQEPARPPSALSRAKAPTAPLGALSRVEAPTTPLRALSRSGTGAVAEPDVRPEDLDQDGAAMAIRAFAVATALVGAGAACVALGLRATLGVRSLEELADYLHTWGPSLRAPSALVPYLPEIPCDEADVTDHATDVEQRLETTDDVLEWLRLARVQLDEEMAAHTAERVRRLEARSHIPSS